MRRFSLKTKIFVVVSCALCGTVGITAILWLRYIEDVVVERALDSMEGNISLVRETLEGRGDMWGSPEHMDPLADWLGSRLRVRVTLITPEGKVVGDSQLPLSEIPLIENHFDRSEVQEALKGKRGKAVRFSTTMGMDLLYMAYAMGPKEAPGLVVRLAVPWNELDPPIRKGRLLLLVAVLLALGSSVACLFVVMVLVNRDLETLARRASRMLLEGGLEGKAHEALAEVRDIDRIVKAASSVVSEEMQRLKEARTHLQALVEGITEGLLLVDQTGRIILVNKSLQALLESAVDPVGRTPSEAYRQPELQEAMERCLREGTSSSLELRVTRPKTRVLEVSLSPAGDRGVLAVFRDITEYRRLEEMRRDWVASASHELRTPVSAIRGYVETLMEVGLEDPIQTRKFLEALYKNCIRLQKILDDLLDLSRLESGPWVKEKASIVLEELIDHSMEALLNKAKAKEIALLKEVSDPRATLEGDPRQLEQALVNLLENAINYTDPGGKVTVKASLYGQDVHIKVQDTGIGIPPEHLPRIFERFYRVDKDRSRATGGTGLGLSIVKHVVQNHGGRIEVQSTPGKGSSFKLVLPAWSKPTS